MGKDVKKPLLGPVRYIKLQNSGAFVVKIKIEYIKKHADKNGNISYSGDWESWHADGNRDICLGAERTVDLCDSNIPTGSQVMLKADVVWGKDNTADQMFIFDSKSANMAIYTIDGTTLDNDLTLDKYK